MENKMKENNQIDDDNSILVSDEWYQIYTTQREDNVKLAKKLLRMQLDHNIKINKIEEVLGCGDLIESFPLDLLDIVADLLGVPADNTREYEHGSPEYYCRDWCWDTWFCYKGIENPNTEKNDVDREKHIDWFIKTMEEHTLEYRRENAN